MRNQCLLAGTWKRSSQLPCWLPRGRKVLHQSNFFKKSTVEPVDHNWPGLNPSVDRSSVVSSDTENISDFSTEENPLFSENNYDGLAVLVQETSVLQLNPHWGIESFCLLKPTVTFGAQLWDASRYCLFGQKYEDMLSPKGGECQSGKLLWWSDGMILAQNARDKD